MQVRAIGLWGTVLAALLLAYPASVFAQEDLFDAFEDIFSDDEEDAPAPAAEERRGPPEDRGGPPEDRGPQAQGGDQGGGGGGRGRGRGHQRQAKDSGLASVFDEIGVSTSSENRPLGEPSVAMVQSIAAAPQSELNELDYLFAGDSIALGNDGELVLEYLDSCRREHIRGGTVTIGMASSEVAGGRITAETTQCQQLALFIPEQASEAGATVDRIDINDSLNWREQVVNVAQPTFAWHDNDTVLLQIVDADLAVPEVLWQVEAAGGQATYPDDAPALAIGRPYAVRIEGAAGVGEALFSIDPGLEVGEVLTARVVAIRP